MFLVDVQKVHIVVSLFASVILVPLVLRQFCSHAKHHSSLMLTHIATIGVFGFINSFRLTCHLIEAWNKLKMTASVRYFLNTFQEFSKLFVSASSGIVSCGIYLYLRRKKSKFVARLHSCCGKCFLIGFIAAVVSVLLLLILKVNVCTLSCEGLEDAEKLVPSLHDHICKPHMNNSFTCFDSKTMAFHDVTTAHQVGHVVFSLVYCSIHTAMLFHGRPNHGVDRKTRHEWERQYHHAILQIVLNLQSVLLTSLAVSRSSMTSKMQMVVDLLALYTDLFFVLSCLAWMVYMHYHVRSTQQEIADQNDSKKDLSAKGTSNK
ncbi:hypothetical protein L596_029359 [Steinernema carpocapsae]|uniref:Uncharacterized protein n=1 Tax=Steinernema carpocapsae TaxID=34508 RepID=A0A4U5LUE2_STECR|nr:hypothetical protein L596_029359 [Steinernema carpocapsae]